MPGRTVVTIGNFDGVHVGHAALVRAARRVADEGGHRVVVLSFDPHPMTVLDPGRAPHRIGGFERRVELLKGLGADEVRRLAPSDRLLALGPREFIAETARELGPAAIVEGRDFRFGKGRAGDVALLERLGAETGFGVDLLAPVEVALDDRSIVTASSTIARWLIRHGRVRDAAIVLGRPHELVGEVIAGDRLGRTLGFPTANLRTDDLLPADGVYAGVAHLPDGRRARAAISVGTRPTFDGRGRRVEPYLLDVAAGAGGNIAGLPEYGWRMRLEFTGFVRDQVRVESAGALCRQMDRDVARVRTMLDDATEAAAR
ncbi:MAG: bifunctional riboflavin kinase/FMN adenylyltransferase [Phycisphaerae bacterium]|nr:bifunctional riboflavin kinase/FMN adenylyltransferase [Phycisphaerae bacterium]